MTRTHRGVLVVDDDVEIRSVMWALLTDEGYHVRTAVNGRDALAILSSWCPDVILLDMMMPTMDGPTFLTIQQSNPKLRRIPVILVSAAHDLMRRVDGLAAADALAKPFQIDTLLMKVASRIRGAQAHE